MWIWIRRSDSFSAFLYDYVEEDYDGHITKNDLRNVYVGYCRHHKVKKVSIKSIKEALELNFGAYDDKEYIDGVQKRIWKGIKFKTKKDKQDNKSCISSPRGNSKFPIELKNHDLLSQMSHDQQKLMEDHVK